MDELDVTIVGWAESAKPNFFYARRVGLRRLSPTYITLVALGLFSGCASQNKRQEAELGQLLEWYPGRYSNVEQAEADARAGRPVHAALELGIVRVYAPAIGDFVYYGQENAADDPRRVVAQRVVSFQIVKGQGIVQSLWSLAEPMRWRDAHLNPDLFKSLQPHDFAPLPGCDLIWTYKDGLFTGANDARSCRSTSSTTGCTIRMDLRAELTPDELALTDLSYDVAGKVVQGNAAEPFYRFRRR